MTRTLALIPIVLIATFGVYLLGQQMVQNAPAAAEAAERLLSRPVVVVVAPASAVAIPMPEAPKFADRELNPVELLIMAKILKIGPHELDYGNQNGGRVGFFVMEQVPYNLAFPTKKYTGWYYAVFTIKSWSGQTPTALGFVLEIGGPTLGIDFIRTKYCLAYQISPVPGYTRSYDAPDPKNEGWDRGPCQ